MTGDDPFKYDLYIDDKISLLKVLFNLIIRSIGHTLNYHLMKSGKVLIYEPFHRSKHHHFGYLSYGILTVEYNKVQAFLPVIFLQHSSMAP